MNNFVGCFYLKSSHIICKNKVEAMSSVLQQTKNTSLYSYENRKNENSLNFNLIYSRKLPTYEYIDNPLHKESPIYCNNVLHFASIGTCTNIQEYLEKYNISYDRDNNSKNIFNLLCSLSYSSIEEYATFISTKLKGSYAISLEFNGKLLLINTYKIIYYLIEDNIVFFSTKKQCLQVVTEKLPIYKVDPYSYIIFNAVTTKKAFPIHPPMPALIVASGGLDSTVVISQAVKDRGAHNVHLVYFKYGCKAQTQEIHSIINLKKHFDVKLSFISLNPFGNLIKDFTTLSANTTIKEDEKIKHIQEWIPARNTIMISYAIALAEIYNYGAIYIGTNEEEAGAAFPDSDVGFVEGFNAIMPYITPKYFITIENPIGNLVKHEIVKLGQELNSPMHLSWSCYKGDIFHCGECAPCIMRKKAFKINKLQDTIKYIKE